MIGSLILTFICFLLLTVIYFCQRWIFHLYITKDERTPRYERWAVLWGAIGAPILCIATSWFLATSFGITAENVKDFKIAEGIFFGPLYEEFWKALAPFSMLFLLKNPSGRKLFVIGAFAGLGFFLTETAISMLAAIKERDAADLTNQILMRSLALSFLHPLSTALIGLGIGIGASLKNIIGLIAFSVIGFAAGSFSHMFNNLVATAINHGERLDQSEFFGIHVTLLIMLLIISRIRILVKDDPERADIVTPQTAST